ncbi:MAG: class I SAM-dependent methyltransferase, partial [Rhodanobacter sp.]
MAITATINARRHVRRDGIPPAMRQRTMSDIISGHYAHRGHRLYVRWKLANDPACAVTTKWLRHSALPVLDIGCGIGLLGQYLYASGVRSPYIGIDHDARKIDAARAAMNQAAASADIQWHCVDAAVLPPVHGHVVLLDVLHYLDASQQRMLLKAATTHL